MKPAALTIAGSDPSGGAGLQADLKTFHQLGVYGMSAVTLLTVQNTLGVEAVEVLRPQLVVAQIDAVVRDIPPAAAKTGALGSAEVIEAVAGRARSFAFPLVVDPVMVSKHGDPLLADPAVRVLVERLLPLAAIVTPNRSEARVLSGIEVTGVESAAEAAKAIALLGARAVVIKGIVEGQECVDLLWTGTEVISLALPLLRTRSTHGSGCTFSAAIAAGLALGSGLEEAVGRAKRYVHRAIAEAPGRGGGVGPLEHHAGTEPHVG